MIICILLIAVLPGIVFLADEHLTKLMFFIGWYVSQEWSVLIKLDIQLR
jgi:hypothetical protein